MRVAATHSRVVWQPPSMHLPARQRSKPGQSPSLWHGGLHSPLMHVYSGLRFVQSSVTAQSAHLPPRHLLPCPVLEQVASSMHLVMHLFASQSRLFVLHTQSASYCLHEASLSKPAS